MTKLLRCCSFLLMFSIFIGLIPHTALSVNYVEEHSTHGEINQEYLEEMNALGFSEEDVVALQDWNTKIINASSMQEVDMLMDEYNDITQNTALSTNASSNSIYTSTGGTLILDYVGESNPISQAIYTKIVYLPADQALVYHTVMNSEDGLDYLLDEFISAGVSIVTAKVAAEIAAHFCLPIKKLEWLIGGTLGIMVWLLQNIDKQDFDDAINNSIMQKVKLEFYYVRFIAFPHYQEFHTYEPWNSLYIDIPENYNYTWYQDIYEYNDEIHSHTLTYAPNNNGTHAITCNSCSEEASDDCDLYYYCSGLNKHRAKCTHCNYTTAIEACNLSYISNDNGTHTKSCSICSEVFTENCHLIYTNLADGRHSISCAECDYRVMSTLCDLTYTANDDNTHTATCTLCGDENDYACGFTYEYSGDNSHHGVCGRCGNVKDEVCAPESTYCGDGDQTHAHTSVCPKCDHVYGTGSTACTFAYKSNGENTHVYACTQCRYVQSGPSACMFKSDNTCRFCGALKNSASFNSQEEDFSEN